jgi:hypothetical protein
MNKESKDLCKTCEHYWLDFPLPLDSVVAHCEILDEEFGLSSSNMDERVEYPCLECPFNYYIKKK